METLMTFCAGNLKQITNIEKTKHVYLGTEWVVPAPFFYYLKGFQASMDLIWTWKIPI